MIRPDPRQFDMFAALAPSSAPAPMSKSGWEAISILDQGAISAAKVEASYSAASLSGSGKVLRPFAFRGNEWVNTAGAFFRGNADYECYRIVCEQDFAGPGEALTYHNHPFHGPHREQLGGYHGMKAKRGSVDVVLIGPPVVFVSKAVTS